MSQLKRYLITSSNLPKTVNILGDILTFLQSQEKVRLAGTGILTFTILVKLKTCSCTWLYLVSQVKSSQVDKMLDYLKLSKGLWVYSKLGQGT